MNEETKLVIYKAINSFVSDLNLEFGKHHKPLLLYNRLISHTSILHDKSIKKHISLYEQFCVKNREAIIAQDQSKLADAKIMYSPRVYIDMVHIFKHSDKETAPLIWKHLLNISAYFDNSGKSLEALKSLSPAGPSGPSGSSSGSGVDEEKFLQDILSKVQSLVGPNVDTSNPMQTILTLAQSGVFQELLTSVKSNLSNGKFNVMKLMSAAQGMISKLSDNPEIGQEAKQAITMINGMMSTMIPNMSDPSGKSVPQMPDMSMMLKMFSSMMTEQMGTSTLPSIQEKDESDDDEPSKPNPEK